MAITHSMTDTVNTMTGSNNTKANKKTKMHVSAGDRAVEIVCYIIFTIAAFLCLYPFYYIIINTISANDISARGDILFLPQNIHFHNYNNSWHLDCECIQNGVIALCKEDIEMLHEQFDCHELDKDLESFEARGEKNRPLLFYFAIGEIGDNNL